LADRSGKPGFRVAQGIPVAVALSMFHCRARSLKGTRLAGPAAKTLRPGGRLALVSVARADEWHCDGMGFPTLNLTRDGMKDRIAGAGLQLLEIREIESKDVSVRDQGYGSFILTAAEKSLQERNRA
jgi:hypothetical protein